MTEDTTTVSVAILTWNRKEQVLKAIRSAYEQSYPPLEIVVVDSASTDGSPEAISAAFPSVKVVRLHRNLGCPEGRNIALANCRGTVIFSLDDDGWLAPNTLEECVRTFQSDPGIGVVGCRILAPEDADDEIDGNAEDSVTTKFSGGATAHRKESLGAAGYYPSDFFRQAEEGDLALRLIENGYTIVRCPKAVMYHKRPQATDAPRKHFFYATRNSLFTITRQYPFLFLIPAILQSIISWNYLGVRTFSLHCTLWGTLNWLAKTPWLLAHRRPVSSRTIRTVIDLRARDRLAEYRPRRRG